MVPKNIPSIRLREVREQRGWTQVDLAEKVGVTERTVGRWERGEAFPTSYALTKLCMLFNMTQEELGLRRAKNIPGTEGGVPTQAQVSLEPVDDLLTEQETDKESALELSMKLRRDILLKKWGLSRWSKRRKSIR